MNPAAKILFDYIRDVIYDPDNAKLDLESLPEDLKELGQGIQYFATCVLETGAMAKAMSKGDINMKLPSPENEIAAPLKALHAVLKHLTWQAQQVAKGDYQQRIDFMGEFAEAFNTMTEQLDHQRSALLEEIEKVRKKTQALEQSNQLFEAVTDQISQWIIVMDGTTFEWLFSNHDTSEILSDPDSESKLRVWMKRQTEIYDEKPYSAELELSNEKGFQYFSVEIHPLSWYEHNALAFVLTDISAETEYLHLLQNAAYIDKLTDLYNRHYGMRILNEWVDEKRAFILCFADIDNLKYVNDMFGHSEGDNYILAVAGLLRDFSPDAVVCRLGGDEFVLLVQDWSHDKAKERMEELRNRLIRYGDSGENMHNYDHSISYGIIQVGSDNILRANDLLNIADERMYQYKRIYKLRRKNLR